MDMDMDTMGIQVIQGMEGMDTMGILEFRERVHQRVVRARALLTSTHM